MKVSSKLPDCCVLYHLTNLSEEGTMLVDDKQVGKQGTAWTELPIEAQTIGVILFVELLSTWQVHTTRPTSRQVLNALSSIMNAHSHDMWDGDSNLWMSGRYGGEKKASLAFLSQIKQIEIIFYFVIIKPRCLWDDIKFYVSSCSKS